MMESNPRRYCLIGYRACGKTTVARLLSRALGLEMFDTDEVIAAEEGRTIAEIFADSGEEYFRRKETEVLIRLLRRPGGCVLATGGGIPAREENRRAIRASGALSVLLTAQPRTILRRMTADARNDQTRPALTALPPEEEIRAMLDRRRGYYKELADLTLATDDKTPEELVHEILEARIP